MSENALNCSFKGINEFFDCKSSCNKRKRGSCDRTVICDFVNHSLCLTSMYLDLFLSGENLFMEVKKDD